MATYTRTQVVIDQLQNQYGNNGFSQETVEVTWTATMGDGSILKADNTEVAETPEDTGTAAVKVINAPAVAGYGYQVGDKVSVNVAVRGCTLKLDQMKFADGTKPTAAKLSGLAANMNIFK